MLFLNNDDIRAVLTMDMAIDALRESYMEVARARGFAAPG